MNVYIQVYNEYSARSALNSEGGPIRGVGGFQDISPQVGGFVVENEGEYKRNWGSNCVVKNKADSIKKRQ